ncbi:DUF3244 domain-containing protein [Bacteroides sp.]|uniref:DUF3244 domain-containing protein n=1 Tax=Bacteroides sp. TaxID=29523 RepID=UPI003AB84C6F
MKQLLFILILLIISRVEVSARASSNNYTIIELSQNDNERELPEDGNETRNSPRARSIILQPAYAYLYNNVVSIIFEDSFSAATITIVNEATGETVYSKSHNSPTSLNIDLSGKRNGRYLLEIEADDTYLEGQFSL